jgi:hypothetical protein
MTTPLEDLIVEASGLMGDLEAYVIAGSNASWLLVANAANSQLTFRGKQTGSLTAASLTAEALQSALEGLPTIDDDNVLVVGETGGGWVVTLQGALANKQQPVGALSGTGVEITVLSLGAPSTIGDIPVGVWYQAIANGLRDLSRYAPLEKSLTLEIASGDLAKTLPDDFIAPVEKSFNRAVNPCNYAYTWRSFVFTLQSATSAASDLPTYLNPGPSIFQSATQFRFLDDGEGKKRLAWNLAAQSAKTLDFDYLAQHQVTDELITVPDSKRDLLLLLVCKYACRAMARNLAGDKLLNPHYTKLAKDFGDDYENRTRFTPIGIAG